MANKTNPRRQGTKRTETGPSYESHNPGKGCNSTHVARSRRKWKRRAARAERRTGTLSQKFGITVKKRWIPGTDSEE